MPMRSPHVIHLAKGEHAELPTRSREYASPYRDVVRAKIVLLASHSGRITPGDHNGQKCVTVFTDRGT
jgi:hypothetical protein